MTPEEIIKGNKAIEGFKLDAIVNYKQTFNYHTDWNQLMIVVEKIESIKDLYHGHFGVYIGSNGCTIQSTNFRPDKRIPDPPHYFNEETLDTKIMSTWLSVVRFIEWYAMRLNSDCKEMLDKKND